MIERSTFSVLKDIAKTNSSEDMRACTRDRVIHARAMPL